MTVPASAVRPDTWARADRVKPHRCHLTCQRRVGPQSGLSADERADLNGLARRIGVSGDRYNPAGMAMINR